MQKELSRFGKILEKVSPDTCYEMANLYPEDTGIPGYIYISTKQGSHGHRVKYYRTKPGDETATASFSIEPEPKVLKSNVKIKANVLKKIQQFVSQNHQELLRFWNEGSTWRISDVAEFTKSLKKV